jgi:hypothetical protein
MRVFLPETYEHLDRNQIRAIIIHFDPEARDTLNLVGCMSVKKGRVVKLEVGPNFFKYCQVRGGKLNLLLGQINCVVSNAFVPDVEILTSDMEIEPINKTNNELNAKQLPELRSKPINSPLSLTSAVAVEDLLSEVEERKKVESEGWTKVSREVINRW